MNSQLINEIDITNQLDIEVSLEILVELTLTYLEAFEVPCDFDFMKWALTEYKAFQCISAYYIDQHDICFSFVHLHLDWKNYSIIASSDDQSIISNRRFVYEKSPKKLMEDAHDVINKKVKELKKQRGYVKTRIVVTYDEKFFQNKEALAEVRNKGHLAPFVDGSIRYSNQISNKVSMTPSLGEDSLTIDYYF